MIKRIIDIGAALFVVLMGFIIIYLIYSFILLIEAARHRAGI